MAHSEDPALKFIKNFSAEQIGEMRISWKNWIEFIERFDSTTQNLLKALTLADGYPFFAEWITTNDSQNQISDEKLQNYAHIASASKLLRAGSIVLARKLIEVVFKTKCDTITPIAILKIARGLDQLSAEKLLSLSFKLGLLTDDEFVNQATKTLKPIQSLILALELEAEGYNSAACQLYKSLRSIGTAKEIAKPSKLILAIQNLAKDRDYVLPFESLLQSKLLSDYDTSWKREALLKVIWQQIYNGQKHEVKKLLKFLDTYPSNNKKCTKVLNSIFLALREFEKANVLVDQIREPEWSRQERVAYQLRLDCCFPITSSYLDTTLSQIQTNDLSIEAKFWMGRSLNLAGCHKKLLGDTNLNTTEDGTPKNTKELLLTFNRAIAMRSISRPAESLDGFLTVFKYHNTTIWKWMAAFERSLTFASIDQFNKSLEEASFGCDVRSTDINNRLNPCHCLTLFFEGLLSGDLESFRHCYDAAQYFQREWMNPQFGIQNWAFVFRIMCSMKLNSEALLRNSIEDLDSNFGEKLKQHIQTPETSQTDAPNLLKQFVSLWMPAYTNETFEYKLIKKLTKKIIPNL
ncbi:hypothetical protein MLD52_01665 [Puniceicoccaceae bacterium K14]|nr:hypothetical protein [Puniceicoccaceae bacterium K14]